MAKVLVTGAAGFIGFHLCRRLVDSGGDVVGLDNLNDYYDVRLKRDRLAQFDGAANFRFVYADIADRAALAQLFEREKFAVVAHLAAQAGVRYSITHPQAYVDSNLVGFGNVLEGCRQTKVAHLVFASSSSVYGASARIPFSEHDAADHPVSFYAATKRANELMAHAYSHLYGLPATGLRFFTVYGPWGRPDMAVFLFTKAILEGRPIDVFNQGQMRRDFTYVDDVVECVARVLDRPPSPNAQWSATAADPATSNAPFRIYNIGNHQPVELMRLIEVVENCVGRKAVVNLLPMQPGDVPETYAENDDLRREMGFQPDTPIEQGVAKFVEWFRSYYRTG